MTPATSRLVLALCVLALAAVDGARWA